MQTQAQRKEALLREADQIWEAFKDLPLGDPRRLDLAQKLRDTLAAYQAVPSDEALRAQRDARYDEISAQMQDPELSPEAFLALADEQLQLLDEMRAEDNAELIAQQEALLRDLHAIEVRRSFRYQFHCRCYGFRGIIWLTFFMTLIGLPVFLSLSTDYPWMGLQGVLMVVGSLVWAVWSSRPPQDGDGP